MRALLPRDPLTRGLALFVGALVVVAAVASVGVRMALPAAQPAAHGGMDMRPAEAQGAPIKPLEQGGGALLAPSRVVDGVREFELRAEVVRWTILRGVAVGAYTYNGIVPGPELRLREGERVRVRVTNALPEPTSVHWHGLLIDNAQDGAAGVTQEAIAPGATYTYEWTARPAGTFFYHTHVAADRQQPLGLTGPLVIEPATGKPAYAAERTLLLHEWNVDPRTGETRGAMAQSGMFPNFFTINGKSYPATETIEVRAGDRVRLNIVGAGQFVHPMHLHGQPFTIVATDGNPVPEGARLVKDTVLVGPGERYDVEFTARAPGKWLLHCHIADHTTNNGAEEQGGGGLTMLIVVRER